MASLHYIQICRSIHTGHHYSLVNSLGVVKFQHFIVSTNVENVKRTIKSLTMIYTCHVDSFYLACVPFYYYIICDESSWITHKDPVSSIKYPVLRLDVVAGSARHVLQGRQWGHCCWLEERWRSVCGGSRWRWWPWQPLLPDERRAGTNSVRGGRSRTGAIALFWNEGHGSCWPCKLFSWTRRGLRHLVTQFASCTTWLLLLWYDTFYMRLQNSWFQVDYHEPAVILLPLVVPSISIKNS